MFEDIVRHSKYRQAGLKRSRYERLVDILVRKNLLLEVERRRGSEMDTGSRNELLRRASEIIKNRPLPEETYEVWHSGKLGESPLVDELIAEAGAIEKHESNNDNNEDQDIDEDESDESSDESSDSLDSEYLLSDHEQEDTSLIEEEDDEVHPDTRYAARKLKKWNSLTDTTRSWAKDRYILTSAGMEFPGLYDERKSVVNSHISNLLNLLHINILYKRWDQAYRAFGLLLRFELVDLRAIWPLGLEILSRRKEEMIKNKTGSKLELMKCRRFLEWLELVYPVLPSVVLTTQSRVGPVFRAGSRRHAPAFVAAGLWQLLVDKSYNKLRETLDELLLVPPYSIDGGFFYIKALCCLCENVQLADLYVNFDARGFPEDVDIGDLADDMLLLGSKDAIQARVLSNISQIEDLIASCESLGFAYAKWDFDAQMKMVKGYLEGSTTSLVKPSTAPEEVSSKLGFSFLHGKAEQAPMGPHTIPEKHLHKFATVNFRTSWVWNWFSKDGGVVRCLKCFKEVKRDARSSTKSLLRHLKHHGISEDTHAAKLFSLKKEKPVAAKVNSKKAPKTRRNRPKKPSSGSTKPKTAIASIPSPPATAGEIVSEGSPTKRRKVSQNTNPSPSPGPEETERISPATFDLDPFSNTPETPAPVSPTVQNSTASPSIAQKLPSPIIKVEATPVTSPAPLQEIQQNHASPEPQPDSRLEEMAIPYILSGRPEGSPVNASSGDISPPNEDMSPPNEDIPLPTEDGHGENALLELAAEKRTWSPSSESSLPEAQHKIVKHDSAEFKVPARIFSREPHHGNSSKASLPEPQSSPSPSFIVVESQNILPPAAPQESPVSGPPETPNLPDNPDLAIAVKEEILDELNVELLAGTQAAQTPDGPQFSSPTPQTPPPAPFSPETDSPESLRFMSARKPVRRQANFSPESTFAESQGEADMSIRFREYAQQTNDPFRVDRSMLEDTEESFHPAGQDEEIPDTLRFVDELQPQQQVKETQVSENTRPESGRKILEESYSEYKDARSDTPEQTIHSNESSEETQFFSFQDTA